MRGVADAEPVYVAMTDHQALEQRLAVNEAQADGPRRHCRFYAAFADMLNCEAA